MVRCKELGMHCVTLRDGYYILGPVCVGVGLLILVRQYFIFDWLCHLVMIRGPHCYVYHCSPYWLYHWLCVCILIFEFTKLNIWMTECLTVLQLTLGQEQEQKWKKNCRYGCGGQHHSCNVNHERLGGGAPSQPPTPPTTPRPPRLPPPPCRRAQQPVWGKGQSSSISTVPSCIILRRLGPVPSAWTCDK